MSSYSLGNNWKKKCYICIINNIVNNIVNDIINLYNLLVRYYDFIILFTFTFNAFFLLSK